MWWLASTAIAVFVGAWVAGRLAGMPTKTDGMLHGIVTWAAATLLGLYLLTSTVGSIIGGTFGVLGNVAQGLGQGTQSLAQGAMQVLPDEIRSQAEQLFNRAPAAVDQAQRAVNIRDIRYDDPKRHDVRQLLEADVPLGHLLPDRVGMLLAAADLGLQPVVLEI